MSLGLRPDGIIGAICRPKSEPDRRQAASLSPSLQRLLSPPTPPPSVLLQLCYRAVATSSPPCHHAVTTPVIIPSPARHYLVTTPSPTPLPPRHQLVTVTTLSPIRHRPVTVTVTNPSPIRHYPVTNPSHPSSPRHTPSPPYHHTHHPVTTAVTSPAVAVACLSCARCCALLCLCVWCSLFRRVAACRVSIDPGYQAALSTAIAHTRLVRLFRVMDWSLSSRAEPSSAGPPWARWAGYGAAHC